MSFKENRISGELTKLDLSSEFRKNKWNIWEQNPNIPDARLETKVKEIKDLLGSKEVIDLIKSEPMMQVLHTQTLNHLLHVSLHFQVEEGSEDYPHKLVLNGPYPFRPTLIALEKSKELIEILDPEQIKTTPFRLPNKLTIEKLRSQQKEITREITSDPLLWYEKLSQRLKSEGPNAHFPEFKTTVQYLMECLMGEKIVESVCINNRHMNYFREIVLNKLHNVLDVQQDVVLPYTETIFAINRALDFFEVLRRAQLGESAPYLYHSACYEYYLHYLISDQNHILFPTTSSFSISELIKTRGVPIGFAGVNTASTRVDGFLQTPVEFFYHDIDHTRRKYQFLTKSAARRGVMIDEFVKYSTRFIESILIPEIFSSVEDNSTTSEIKKAERVLLFEVLCEDAQAATPDDIYSAIVQPPFHRTPFERIEGNMVTYYMDLESSNISCVFRKLNDSFFDTPEKRIPALGEDIARSEEGIIQAASRLIARISPSLLAPKNLEYLFKKIIHVDEKLPFKPSSNVDKNQITQ